MSPKGGFICSLKPVQIYSPVLPNLESEWMLFGEGEGCWRGALEVLLMWVGCCYHAPDIRLSVNMLLLTLLGFSFD